VGLPSEPPGKQSRLRQKPSKSPRLVGLIVKNRFITTYLSLVATHQKKFPTSAAIGKSALQYLNRVQVRRLGIKRSRPNSTTRAAVKSFAIGTDSGKLAHQGMTRFLRTFFSLTVRAEDHFRSPDHTEIYTDQYPRSVPVAERYRGAAAAKT